MKLKRLILMASLCCFSVNAFSADETVKMTVDIEQTLEVSTPADPAVAASGESINTEWIVTSNNAFKYQFSGTSVSDDGIAQNIPVFSKQDVDAAGNLIADNFDHLDTTFGILITEYGSVQKGEIWGAGTEATNSPENLVADPTDPNSPYGATGRIMTTDDTSTANINLYAKGIADATDQSGVYDLNVMLTVTAEEQLTSAATP